jgi:AraC-like DNA-binding protein
MDYVRRVPGPPLDAFIDDLYYLEGAAPYPRLKVPPMPSAHLMVNLGEPFRMHDSGGSAPPTTCAESWCMGLWTRHYVVDWPLPVRLVGVHFKPGGLYPFLQTPLFELRDQVVPLEAIWGGSAVELRERLDAAPTKRAALTLLDDLLRARLMEAQRGSTLVQYAIEQIDERHGALSIRALSDHAGVSSNHLSTEFKRLVGIPPKRLARIYRFARVVLSIDAARPVDWSFLAHQGRYSDQSHFNKDFVAFTGLSPTDYLRLRRRFLVENPHHPLDLGPLPTD